MNLSMWNKLSIKQRLTISYIVFILVPFCLLAVYSYVQTRTIQQEQTIGNLRQGLSVVQNSIEGKLNLVESISHNITYNMRLHSFLDEPFQDGSMDVYLQAIRPIVHYSLVYNEVEISDIKVYMQNHTIPEGFGSFYHDSAVLSKPWYQSFMASEQRSVWKYFPDDRAFTYLQKIVSMQGNMLGVTGVTMQLQDMVASLGSYSAEGSDVFVRDMDGHVLFDSSRTAPSIIENASLTRPQFERDGTLFVQSSIERVGFILSMSEMVNSFSMQSTQLFLTASFVLAIILSLLLFYQVLKSTFVKIKVSIRAMDHSIRTGFKELIPVKRNDEIGVISEKFNTLLVQIGSLVDDMVKRETLHKDAQLSALQSQINPHFIYNTLNLFSAKTELAGLYDVSEAFADFGDILRYNMNHQTAYATIQLELNHVLNYIRLQQLRYEDRLKIEFNCNEALLHVPILRFILQPITENCIVHGMWGRDHMLITIDINGRVEGEIEIKITDNGAGITADRLQLLNHFLHQNSNSGAPGFAQSTSSSGIGLANIKERLRLFYGDEYTIAMESTEGVFTTTILRIPSKGTMGEEHHVETANRG